MGFIEREEYLPASYTMVMAAFIPLSNKLIFQMEVYNDDAF